MDVSLQLVLSHLVLGLNFGAFYGLLGVGLAVVVRVHGTVSFACGAVYLFATLLAMLSYDRLGLFWGVADGYIGFWLALLGVPVLTGLVGSAVEGNVLRRWRRADPVLGLALLAGLAWWAENGLQQNLTRLGKPFGATPEALQFSVDLGFMTFPGYRLVATGVLLAAAVLVWWLMDCSAWGRALRQPKSLFRVSQGHRYQLWGLCFFGMALAGLSGVLGAPFFPLDSGAWVRLVIIVFAVLVVGGARSMLGVLCAGLALGLLEALARVFWPMRADTMVYVGMVVLLGCRALLPRQIS